MKKPTFIIVAVLLFACSLAAESQKEKDLAAQHLRDLATIDRLVRENTATALSAKNTAGNGAAITKLGTKLGAAGKLAAGQSTASAVEAKTAATDTKAVVDSIQVKAEAIKTNTEQLQQAVDKNAPINSVPVWIAAIGGIVSMFGVLGSIVLAVLNRGKLQEIHVLADGNLTRISGELQIANEKIAGLRALVTTVTTAATVAQAQVQAHANPLPLVVNATITPASAVKDIVGL